ncbi:MAG: hypothetical protein Q4E54_04950 [Lachnospiraceae bacterium]|nr:hypothetical protein [Lachnospiraceae bacterium]
MLPKIEEQTYKEIITTKNLISFCIAAVAILIFAVGMILKHHVVGIDNKIPVVLFIIAGVVMLVAIAFAWVFFTSPRYKKHKEEYVKALSAEKNKDRKTYVFSRNYMLIAGLFSC